MSSTTWMPPRNNRQKPIGEVGEDLAVSHLEANGYTILDRNYRFSREEIDIIAFQSYDRCQDGGELVFIEVKARRNHNYGRPEEAVTRAKQEAIFRTAEAYLQERKLVGSPCRFDVIAITIEGSKPRIEHIENAFGYFG
ncbi:MAG: YraN family protein [Rubricoccaceae bacterium]|nr:YraN family protein [Rubricoccaceae bacterium]